MGRLIKLQQSFSEAQEEDLTQIKNQVKGIQARAEEGIKKRIPEFEFSSGTGYPDVTDQITQIQQEISLLKKQSSTKSLELSGKGFDAQQMESALNDWLMKIETHINQIEERVFTSVQQCD